MSATLVRSATTADAPDPISATAASSFVSARPLMITWAPCPARFVAIASLIPDEPPVTRASLFFKRH